MALADEGGRAPHVTRELLGRASVYTAGTALQLAASVLVVPAATRLLPPDQYGTVAAGLVVTQVVTVLGAAGLHGAITREHFMGAGPNRAVDARGLVTTAMVTAGAVALIAHLSADLWTRGDS